jgi:hypothetical protein
VKKLEKLKQKIFDALKKELNIIEGCLFLDSHIEKISKILAELEIQDRKEWLTQTHQWLTEKIQYEEMFVNEVIPRLLEELGK